LLLDEATSALDTESEHIVQASLDNLLASSQRTTVIIAHRLSTIRNADRIAVLSFGNVVEEGTHDELVKIPNGHYKQLVNAQVQSIEEGLVHENDEVNTPTTTRRKKRVHSANLPHDGLKEKSEDEYTSSDTTDESEEDAPAVPLSRVWKMTRPEAMHMALGSLGAILNGATFPIWGVLLTKCTVIFFQLSLGEHEIRHEALKWSMGFVILGVVFASGIVLQNHQFGIASERLTTRLRSMCFEAMLKQDIGWFDLDKNSSGALTTRLATDSATIRTMTAETMNSVLVNVSTLGAAFAIAFYYSWQMTLALLGVFPFIGFASYIQMQSITGTKGKESNDGDIQAGAILSQSINSIRTVASFCLEKYTNDAYLMYLQLSSASDTKVGIMSGIGFSVAQGTMFFAMAFLFWFGGWLILRGTIDFEKMFLVLNPVLLSSFGVGMAAQGMGDSGKAKKSVASIFSIIDRIPPIDCTSDEGIRLSKVHGDIELINVDFSYPSRPDSKIYKGYNLKIQSGQTIALVGGSGSGKSTAINLIERFYDPKDGIITLDGTDLRDLNVAWLREHISIVSQEPVLFAGTIAENIAAGKSGATRVEIEEAAKKANAHDFICQFPEGYETSVGDRGVQVSGGQKQRIAIARAILRDPEVLLLDEATSALDTESERIVQASLDSLLQQKRRTTVIVAHRLSTIRNADVIAVVDGGKIIEKGTHNELLAIPNGIYQSLVARQMHSS